MATPRPPRVVLSELERTELERLVRAYSTGQQLALRARIVLLAGDGWNNLQIARELGVDDETPGKWRRRWLEFAEVPLEDLRVAKRLADAPKPGAPPKFTPEQICQIIALRAKSQLTASDRSVTGVIANWRTRSCGAASFSRSHRGTPGGCSKEADLSRT